ILLSSQINESINQPKSMNNKYLHRLKCQWVGMLAALMLFSGLAMAQTTTITGVVRSEGDMELIPGASILVKGTTRGTTTNLDGEFSIQASPGDVLTISFIGYESQEVPITNQTTNLEVVLKSATSDLEEVVVVGYGSQLKKEVTGSVQTVGSEELKDLPVAQVTQKLQGRLAGVQIRQTSGRPGQGMSVKIRGQMSVTGGSNPLYVVDGFPISGDIASINPDEIEDISVLKDAASTALYGSRAANGVVLIT